MSASLNKVQLIGNLGRDPEVRRTPNGSAVCNVNIATTEVRKDPHTGEKIEDTEWHRLVFFDRLAEIVGEHLKQGRSIYVEGKLRTRKWQDKDGAEKSATEIIVDEMKMLGSRPADGAPSQKGSEGSAAGAPSGATDEWMESYERGESVRTATVPPRR